MNNTNTEWSEYQKRSVWEKGRPVAWLNPDEYRQDIAGAWIKYSEYGNTDDELGFGWEIDHRIPESIRKIDEIPNLQPLQWRNNRSKGDNYPEWTSVVSSSDGEEIKNINKIRHWLMK